MSATAPEMGQSQNPAPRGYSEAITRRAEVYLAQGIRRRNALRMAQRDLAGLEIGGPNPYRGHHREDTGADDITGHTAAWRADR